MAVNQDPVFYQTSAGLADPKGAGVDPAASASKSAKAIITDFLAMYGLESLGDWAWNEYLGGSPVEEIFLNVRNTPEYNKRFPAMKILAEQGRAISTDAYMEYERTTRELLQRYQVPGAMYDTPDMIADLLIKDVSPSEMNQRLQLAASAAYSAPAEVRDALTQQYGVGMGDLVGFYLDPDRAAPLLDQQYKSAQVYGAATQQSVKTDLATAERLAAQGVTYDQARAGFAKVYGTEALGAGAGETVSAAERTNAVFGSEADQKKMERVMQSRAAQFGDQGGAQGGQAGVTGLRAAASQ